MQPDMEKVKSLPPADSHFQISEKVKFQIYAFLLEFSASTARLLDGFSMSEPWAPICPELGKVPKRAKGGP